MRPTLLDKVTGEKAEGVEGSLFWWSQGNGSCDCNRAIAFDGADEELEKKFGEYACYGTERFLAVDVHGDLEGETKESALAKINARYEPTAQHQK